jgi:hypothetical protein
MNNDHGLRLLACENKSKHPTEQRNTEQDVDDDSSSLIGLFFLMAVMVGKKYMYKTKNKAATAKIIWIGERLLKCVWCIIRPRRLSVYSKQPLDI